MRGRKGSRLWPPARAADAERPVGRSPGQAEAFADDALLVLHPSMADLYRGKVEELASALQREDTRVQASEMLRGLIDSIVLIPDDGRLRVQLRGNLAAMLTAAQPPSRAFENALRATAVRRSLGEGGETKRSPETGDLFVPVQMVAGAARQRAAEGGEAAAKKMFKSWPRNRTDERGHGQWP